MSGILSQMDKIASTMPSLKGIVLNAMDWDRLCFALQSMQLINGPLRADAPSGSYIRGPIYYRDIEIWKESGGRVNYLKTWLDAAEELSRFESEDDFLRYAQDCLRFERAPECLTPSEHSVMLLSARLLRQQQKEKKGDK